MLVNKCLDIDEKVNLNDVIRFKLEIEAFPTL